MNRIITGIPGLDQVLDGGFPEFSTVMIAGAPGSGKTILTQQILFNNAIASNVVYLTTLSEPTIKVIRFQQEFEFFDHDRFSKSLMYRDISQMVRHGEAEDILKFMDELVRTHKPSIIAIDSIKAMADMFESAHDFRTFISDLNLHLSIWGCTVLLIGEYRESEILERPESAIADGIIYLYGTEERKHQRRFLRVLKMRGTKLSLGESLYKISKSGIEVYPRRNPEVTKQEYVEFSTRQATGIVGLDGMMYGGIPRGTNTFVTGSTGTGKTILAMSWLLEGARGGEPGLFVSFDEHPTQLISGMKAIGWDLAPLIEQNLLEIMHFSSMEADVDEQSYRIERVAKARNIQRIVIDSITTFEIGMNDKQKYTDYIWSLADYFKVHGISLMLISENRELFSVGGISKHGLSYIADNIIFLYYGQEDGLIHRKIGVLKMRGTGHEGSLREYVITDKGPIVRQLSGRQLESLAELAVSDE